MDTKNLSLRTHKKSAERQRLDALSVDANHLERALRVTPMGRKNYLFCWGELGAQQLGILQSLMVSCRRQGMDPYTYLIDVLQRVSIYPTSEVNDLIPATGNSGLRMIFLLHS